MKRKHLVIGAKRTQFVYPRYIVAVDTHPILGSQYNRKFIGVDTVSVYKDIVISDKTTKTEKNAITSIYKKKKTPFQRVQATSNQDNIMLDTVAIEITTHIRSQKIKTDTKKDFKKASRCLSEIGQAIEHKDLISREMYNCLAEYQYKSIKASQNFDIIKILSNSISSTTEQILLNNNIKEIYNQIDILIHLEMDMICIEEEMIFYIQDIYKSASTYQTLYNKRERLNGFSYGSPQIKSKILLNENTKRTNDFNILTELNQSESFYGEEKANGRRKKILKQKNKRSQRRDDKEIVRGILQNLNQSSYDEISTKKINSYRELQWWRDYKDTYVLLKKRHIDDKVSYEDLIIQSFHY